MTRTAYAVEEYDRESDQWFIVAVFLTRDSADRCCTRWSGEYKHRVVDYGPKEQTPA